VVSLPHDASRGNTRCTVAVDGTQVGGILAAFALHASGRDDTLTVQGDRAGGEAAADATAALLSAGAAGFVGPLV
jgi:hypothetical protein